MSPEPASGGGRVATGGPAADLIDAARRLGDAAQALRFGPPVSYVYNPLRYAREAHERYLRAAAAADGGRSARPVLFLGMNPGPWGMAQTGVPFGEVQAVRDWLGIQTPVGRPSREHPRRPVLGFAVTRSEVSGRRFWSLMRERFGTAAEFFRRHFVANYCPLMFLDAGGANITPDRLRAVDREPLLRLCDEHLLRVLRILQPRWALGIGGFAQRRLLAVQAAALVPELRIGGILHPSPASPRANRGWDREASRQLQELGVW